MALQAMRASSCSCSEIFTRPTLHLDYKTYTERILTIAHGRDANGKVRPSPGRGLATIGISCKIGNMRFFCRMLSRFVLAEALFALSSPPAPARPAPPARSRSRRKSAGSSTPGNPWSSTAAVATRKSCRPRQLRLNREERQPRAAQWEHIVPAWVIGHQQRCWQNGGRSNCAKHDSTYQRAEADLRNLVRASAGQRRPQQLRLRLAAVKPRRLPDGGGLQGAQGDATPTRFAG